MSADAAKRAAADAALEHVRPGMRLGLGTGSTAAFLVAGLGRWVGEGLEVICVPTSEATAALARAEGVPLTTLEAAGRLDLTIDGADEIAPDLALIKGGGGALLREKIVAAASAEMLVIADASKMVEALGAFPLPVEIVPFGWPATRAHVAEAVGLAEDAPEIRLRGGDDPMRTDQGNHILDLALGRIEDPGALDLRLNAIPGVVETGLFVGLARRAIIGHADGRVDRLGDPVGG